MILYGEVVIKNRYLEAKPLKFSPPNSLCGTWNGDYARLKVYLTIGHCFRDVLNEQIRRAQQAATADGVEGVSNDYNDPDYERKWTGYMTVQSVEEAIEAKIEQDETTNCALGKRGTSRSSGLP